MLEDKKFGFIPDVPDIRDLYLKVSRKEKSRRPVKVNLNKDMSPTYNQGSLGSCVFNAISANVQYLFHRQRQPNFMPSRLFGYYLAREEMGTVQEDSGTTIRIGMKVINEYGICKEDPTWPYIEEKFNIRPPQAAFEEAELHQALRYERVRQNAADIETRLSQGYPICFGIAVYKSFDESAKKHGRVPMPNPGKLPNGKERDEYFGGHALLMIGYDQEQNHFIVRNSWGVEWGDKGNIYIPYDYILNEDLAVDFWTITLMEFYKEN